MFGISVIATGQVQSAILQGDHKGVHSIVNMAATYKLYSVVDSWIHGTWMKPKLSHKPHESDDIEVDRHLHRAKVAQDVLGL